MPAKFIPDPNKIYQSNNYGRFVILETRKNDKSRHSIARIRFIDTGYECDTLLCNATKGNVKDATIKPLKNVDSFSCEEKDSFIVSKLRTIWHSMLRRCNNPTHKEYYAYGERGVTIDPAWYDFNTFLNDCKSLPQYDKFVNDPYNYQLDKDFLQIDLPKHLRVYSKDTCVFLSNRDNTNLRAIENARNSKLSSEYFGVCKIKGKYYMGITCNTNKISIYSDDEIAAANAYNYWFEKLHLYDLVKLRNDVPFMSVEEWESHIISTREMVKIV